MARAVVLVAVEEDAAHPPPRPVPGGGHARLPVEALLLRVLARIGRECAKPGGHVRGRDARIDGPRPREGGKITRKQAGNAELLDQQVRLVALAFGGEPRIADRGGHLRAPRCPGQLEAPQLVRAIVRFEVPVGGDVAAGVKRTGVVDLPRADALILQVIGEEGRERRRRFPEERQPRRGRRLGVGIRLPAEVRGHRSRIGKVGLRFGDAGRHEQVVVVDEPRIPVAVDGTA